MPDNSAIAATGDRLITKYYTKKPVNLYDMMKLFSIERQTPRESTLQHVREIALVPCEFKKNFSQ